MSDQNDNLDLVQEELPALKARADVLGVKYHPNISAEKLRERINEHLEAPEEEEKPAKTETTGTESAAQKRARLRKEALALIRIRVTCMNPHKSEWEGEIFTAGNSLVGTHKKYVPFNATDGWHVPRIIYHMIRDRKCQVFYNERVNGRNVRKGKLINEFAIEVLPPLTQAEIDELARRQARSRSID